MFKMMNKYHFLKKKWTFVVHPANVYNAEYSFMTFQVTQQIRNKIKFQTGGIFEL